jgi:hypothetical protein
LLLIPQDKLNAVLAALTADTTNSGEPSQSTKESKESLTDDPWQGLLGENE